MSGTDRELAFEELLRSPLDDERERNPGWWKPLVAGGAIGALLTLVSLAFVARDAADAAPGTTTIPPTTPPPTTVAAVDPDAPFPPGFRQVTEGVAVAPMAAVQVDDVLVISLATAVARDVAEPAVPFSGGRWELETADGTRVAATRTVYEQLNPTVFSLEFPVAPDVGIAALHLLERWELDLRQASGELIIDAVPYVMTEPLSIDVGDGINLRIDALELDVSGGELAWSVTGVDLMAAEPLLNLILDGDGDGYAARTSLGDVFLGNGVVLSAHASSGIVQLVRASSETPGGTTWRLDATLPLIRTVPGELELDVSAVPIDGR